MAAAWDTQLRPHADVHAVISVSSLERGKRNPTATLIFVRVISVGITSPTRTSAR
jgi:hypothetical protein